MLTDNEKYVKRDPTLIIGDDLQMHEEVATVNRNTAEAPFQYTESLFAVPVVKSVGGRLIHR